MNTFFGLVNQLIHSVYGDREDKELSGVREVGKMTVQALALLDGEGTWSKQPNLAGSFAMLNTPTSFFLFIQDVDTMHSRPTKRRQLAADERQRAIRA
jgi:hypothetical protein